MERTAVPEIDVIVGTLGRAHGLSGELFVDLRTDSPEKRFLVGSQLWAGTQSLTVEGFRLQGARRVVRFVEVTDRTTAEALVGTTLMAHVSEDEVSTEDDEYYDHQLIGLDVVTQSGEQVGTVRRVDHLGFQDLLVVGTPGGERLVPFVNDLVPQVDLETRQVILNPIPGLLEDLP